MDIPQIILDDLAACQSAKDAWQQAQTDADAADAACAAACAASDIADASRDAAQAADRAAMDKLESDLEAYFASLTPPPSPPVQSAKK